MSPVGFAAMLLAVAAGACVQGTIGFGLNLTAVPVVALVRPDALPATLVLLAVPLTVSMVAREHHAVDRSGLAWTTVGRLPGTVAGAWVVTAVSDDALSAVIGASVIVAVAMSLSRARVAVTPAAALAAGTASGFMGTATSIGGPPLALVYQHQEGPVLRSTLAAAFTVGTVVSLTALAVAGEVSGDDVELAAALVPALVLGLLVSRPLASRLDGRWLRPAVLVFAAVTGAMAVARGLS